MATERMTLEGTVNKTLALLALVAIGALFAYSIVLETPGLAGLLIIGGGIGGFILAIITFMVRPANPQVLMSCYALVEGLFIGAFSFMVENYYLGGNEGVVLQALVGTVAVFITMLLLYKYEVIKPTEKFTIAIISMAGAIMIVYLFNFIMSFFGTGVPFIHSAGPIGIGISLFIITIAAMMLISNFGMIDAGVRMGAPKQQEWWGAFGVMVTVIWLYFEMLRLIAKLRDR